MVHFKKEHRDPFSIALFTLAVIPDTSIIYKPNIIKLLALFCYLKEFKYRDLFKGQFRGEFLLKYFSGVFVIKSTNP